MRENLFRWQGAPLDALAASQTPKPAARERKLPTPQDNCFSLTGCFACDKS